MHGKQITGRHIIIIDEVGPGVFDVDNQGDMHAAKVCVAALFTFRQYIQFVKDEVQYRELTDQFNSIMGIVKDQKAKPFEGAKEDNIDDIIGQPPTIGG